MIMSLPQRGKSSAKALYISAYKRDEQTGTQKERDVKKEKEPSKEAKKKREKKRKEIKRKRETVQPKHQH